MSRLRVGLIGLGRHGTRYANHLTAGDVKHGTLAAVCRRNRTMGARQARRLRVPFVGDFAELAERSDVEAVAAVIPPAFHMDIVRTCASAGKPLLLEKPLAPAAKQGRHMVRLMEHAGIPFMVAQTLRFADSILRLKREIQSNAPLHSLHVAQHLEPRNLDWETEPAHGAGGILHQTGIHAADLIRFLSEREVLAVRCETRRVHNPRLPDMASAELELEHQTGLFHFHVSKAGTGRHCWAEAVTGGGIVAVDYWNGKMISSGPGGITRQTVNDNPTVAAALEGFCRAVLNGTPVPVPADDALRSLEVVEACNRSSRANGRRTIVSRTKAAKDL